MTIVPGDQPREIVGIVGDTATSRWDRSSVPGLYVPHLQESLRSRVPYGQSRVNIFYMLRTNQPLSSIVPALRRAVADVEVQRTHEIGIRMALGARRAAVLNLVMRQSSLLTLLGLVLGLGAAAMLTKYIQNLLFELTPLDATTFVTMPMLFALIAVIAAYVPARRATKLDPQTVLRCD